MALNEVVKATFFCQLDEQAGITTIAYKQTAAVPAAQLDSDWLTSFAVQLAVQVGDKLKDCMAQEARYVGLKLRTYQVNPVNDREISWEAGAGFGTWPSPGYAPRQVSGLLRKRTASATRRGKGRMYIPFVPLDAMAADGGPVGAYQEALEELADALMGPFTVEMDPDQTTFVSVIADQSRPPFSIPITSLTNAAEFATQRRRGSFSRPNVPVFS